MTTIDDVYAQRNELTIAFAKAALAAGWKAGKSIDPMADPEWANVVYVDLPDGRQVSWHMSPDCVPLLDGLPQYAGTWDGTFIGRETGWSRGIEPVVQQKDPTDPGNDVDVLREHVRHLERRVRQLHAQQAEPVAGVVLNEEGRAALVEHGREEWHCVSRNARRLYIAPPQRKLVPLTDEEAAKACGASGNLGPLMQIVRAVERAHGIKEGGA